MPRSRGDRARRPAAGARRAGRDLLTRARRAARLRLVLPLVRSRQEPEQSAHAVAVGLFWAFTPTFGVQMALCCLHWWVSRTFFGRDFNVVVAMAWTWVTNLFTVGPVYYVCFLLGQVLLGNWSDLSGYRSFVGFLAEFGGSSVPGLVDGDLWGAFFRLVVQSWGLSTVVGSVPVALVVAAVGHQLALRAVRRWRSRRRRRGARRGAHGGAHGGAPGPRRPSA